MKLRGTIVEPVSIVDQDVALLADPGARLTRTAMGPGPVLKIDGSSHVAIHDLEVTDALGSGVGFGLVLPAGSTASVDLRRVTINNNTAGGISMAAAMLTIVDSTISKNQGGGIVISAGQFALVGNFIFSNGAQDSSTGGVRIATSQSASNRLEFNSFNKNQTRDATGSAIECTAGVFTARNNILSGNGTLTNLEQVSGSCSHAYSIVQPGTLPAGSGNLAADPRFADPTKGDLHLLAMSPAIGAADPASDLTGVAARDLDGDLRTRPADIGADAYHAPGGP